MNLFSNTGGLNMTWLIIAVLFGLLIAFLVTGHWKAQLKSVRQKSSAAGYVRRGSLNITQAHEHFLYRQTTVMQKPKNDNRPGSSSGGPVHLNQGMSPGGPVHFNTVAHSGGTVHLNTGAHSGNGPAHLNTGVRPGSTGNGPVHLNTGVRPGQAAPRPGQSVPRPGQTVRPGQTASRPGGVTLHPGGPANRGGSPGGPNRGGKPH